MYVFMSCLLHEKISQKKQTAYNDKLKMLRYKYFSCYLLPLFITVCCVFEFSSSSPVKSRKLFSGYEPQKHNPEWIYWLFPILSIGLFAFYIYVVGKNTAKVVHDREMLRSLRDSPLQVTPPKKPSEDTKQGENGTDLVFFVDEVEAFQLDDLFGAEADLQNQTPCSSLYKVTLHNNVVYVVKRLKKLQVSLEEFGGTIRKIGNMKHPNILPLVAYSSTQEEKLMIYQYQRNGSLLNLLDGM